MPQENPAARAPERMDLSKGVVPIIAACAMLLLVASGCLAAGAWLNDMRRDRSEISISMQLLQNELREMRAKIEVLSLRAQGFEPETFLLRFCLEAERVNGNWRCPVMSAKPVAKTPPG
jgi:hypothetical protein